MMKIKLSIVFLYQIDKSQTPLIYNSYQFLLNEISIIWRAFSLPVLEPLTPQRLEKIISITLTCLYTSVTVAMSNTVISLTNPQPTKPTTTKDEEIDNYGNCIVQKSVSKCARTVFDYLFFNLIEF